MQLPKLEKLVSATRKMLALRSFPTQALLATGTVPVVDNMKRAESDVMKRPNEEPNTLCFGLGPSMCDRIDDPGYSRKYIVLP